jgi:leucyl-tRNA synthetase
MMMLQVLPEYGSGAVMGVPAHDDRDYGMAMAHSINIRPVIDGSGGNSSRTISGTSSGGDGGDSPCSDAYTRAEGTLMGSGQFDGLSVAEGARAITAHAAAEGVGKPVQVTKLRDWLISRQRSVHLLAPPGRPPAPLDSSFLISMSLPWF